MIYCMKETNDKNVLRIRIDEIENNAVPVLSEFSSSVKQELFHIDVYIMRLGAYGDYLLIPEVPLEKGSFWKGRIHFSDWVPRVPQSA